MNQRKIKTLHRKGSALLIVLWAIALMSITVMSTVQIIDLSLSESANQSKNFRALQLAESGLALGLHPNLKKTDSHLQQTLEFGESFAVTFKSEGARLNINRLLINKNTTVLKDLFEQWGMKDLEASTLIDHLIDWVDSDDLMRLNGAENDEYKKLKLIGYPSNEPFRSLEEMELVPGIELLTKAQPKWKESFTVWGDGKLDVNEAPVELIAAVCGVGTVAAESFVQRRLGSDGEIDTKDDFVYTEMNQVRAALGINETQFKTIENQLTAKSDYRRIISVGKIVSHQRSLAIVVRLNTNPVQYLSWIEY